MSKEFVDESKRDECKRDQTECAERALDKANEGTMSSALINRRTNRDGKKETVLEARARVRQVMDSWKSPADAPFPTQGVPNVPKSEIDWTRINDAAQVSHKPEYTGSSVSYYTVQVDNPTTAMEPYSAECNDIIESLHMNFAEGNIFKAIWRRCAARKGLSKKGYADGLYDAEKIVFFGERLVAMEKTK